MASGFGTNSEKLLFEIRRLLANLGTSIVVNTDDLETILTDKSQFTKITDGTDTVLVTAAGEMSVLDSNSGAIKTSVEIMDDWDESDRAKVNPIVGQAGVAGGSGVVGATTQRVTLATDVALPAGTNLIGKVSIDQTTPGTTNKVLINTNGQATMANSTPVVIASDQSTIPVTLPSGAHTLTSTAPTTSAASPIASGASSISFVTSSDFSGTINGVAFPASSSKNLSAMTGKTLPSVAYTVTAGTLYIDVLS